MTVALVTFAAFAYAAAAFLSARDMEQRGLPHARVLAPNLVGLAAAIAHLVYHGVITARLGALDLHFFAAMSLVGALVASGTAVLGLARPLSAVGAVVYPLALATLLGKALSAHPAIVAADESWQIQAHALIALLAYSTLSIAAVVALLLALQDMALRRHRVHWLRYFPPLAVIETLLFQLIASGFLLLTLTLLTGVLFIEDLLAQHLAHKTVFSIASWLVFGALLYGRWRWGWRGQRAARLTLAGMALLLLGFLGSKFVLDIVLGRSL